MAPRHVLRHSRAVKAKRAPAIPADLRERIEAARLDSIALMRTLDRFELADHLARSPDFLALYELDADSAEALAVLNRPPLSMDWRAMVRDTEASLRRLPAARDRVRDKLDKESRAKLVAMEPIMRATLSRADAYDEIPGGMPENR